MKLYTSSWFTKLPPQVVRIGISRGVPRTQSGYRMYRKLAPGPWFRSAKAREYRQLFFEQLAELDPQTVVEELRALAGDKTAALLCFEPPTPGSQWCHRAYVSIWFQDHFGLEVPEYGQEHEGVGWSHPKLPPAFREPPQSQLLF